MLASNVTASGLSSGSGTVIGALDCARVLPSRNRGPNIVAKTGDARARTLDETRKWPFTSVLPISSTASPSGSISTVTPAMGT